VNISMKKQKGIVLFFSLIILIVMTVIGVALAVNSTQSLRMSSAGSERIEAMSIANGGLEQVIANNAGAPFANLLAEQTAAVFNGSQVITPLPEIGGVDVGCQRTSKAAGANLIKCKRAQIINTVTFGRNGLGTLKVAAGIEQQVLTGN
jgi:type IV pilus assembly protein PilX